MAIDILTKQDLADFKKELIIEIKDMIADNNRQVSRWMKGKEVKRLLQISEGTLQSLRIKNLISFKKVGGNYFYAYDEIIRMMEG